MINIKRPVLILILFSLLVGSSLTISGCDYITGEAVKIPALTQPQVIKDITSTEAYALIQSNAGNRDFIIIDVRTPEEYTGGHIENVLNIDFNSADFIEQVDKLNRNVTYIVYCHSGNRSAAASNVMAKLGFKDIYNMTGGISAWEAAGLPIIK